MTADTRQEKRRQPERPGLNVIFDFDLTLFPEESTLGLAKAAVQHHRQRERLLEFLEPPESRKKSFSAGLQGLASLLSVLFSIKKSVISDYCAQSTTQFDPVFAGLCERLGAMDVGVYIVSSGYIEVLSRLAGSLGIDPQNIAANQFAWWGENAVGVKPSVLHGTYGKTKVIRRWQASGQLQGPFIMVGDGPADRRVFEQGLAHGFIQANYYRPGASHSLPGNFQVAETAEQLPMLLYQMLEEMRSGTRTSPIG